ncbi:MAG: hypothetical protein KAX13_11685, partial [Candidatus Krumholzibacteria bacterium]|nr:hypothetical protein [Candidatus Krumholzibacteria bacterium]
MNDLASLINDVGAVGKPSVGRANLFTIDTTSTAAHVFSPLVFMSKMIYSLLVKPGLTSSIQHCLVIRTMSNSNDTNLKERVAAFIRYHRKQFGNTKDRDFWLRWRAGVLMGAIGLFTFQFFAIAFDIMGRTVLAKIFRYGSLLMPVLGILLNDAIGVFADRVFGSIYLPKRGKTARAHSEGEAMFQRQQFEEAVDWFVAAVMADPTDWEAQLRVVEILAERFDDPERLAEERNRLLKTKEVPEGL